MIALTAYLSARKLSVLRAALRDAGAPSTPARPDSPGPGAYVGNVLSRAAACGYRSAVECVIARTFPELAGVAVAGLDL